MIGLVYQGVDTLDVAIKGAVGDEVLGDLETARIQAEAEPHNDFGIPLSIGPDNRAFVVKAHGKKGGISLHGRRYTNRLHLFDKKRP